MCHSISNSDMGLYIYQFTKYSNSSPVLSSHQPLVFLFLKLLTPLNFFIFVTSYAFLGWPFLILCVCIPFQSCHLLLIPEVLLLFYIFLQTVLDITENCMTEEHNEVNTVCACLLTHIHTALQ
jgi:hypothetical protein